MNKTVAIALLALLAHLPGSAAAQQKEDAAGKDAGNTRIWTNCDQAGSDCPPPPVPPAPPAPPSPPSVPAPPAPPPLPGHHPGMAPPPHAAPAMADFPTMPAPPAPPAPPSPPPPPEVPDAAHAACADKASGSRLTWSPAAGETMTGICERKAGRMQFRLREYRRSH